MDDLDVADENSLSTSTSQQNGHSGITLVLPSLRALKAANAGKKSKTKTELEQRLKIPRPIKLKPLKEVLTKLITQIKKRDDYAFFIHPVDPAQVPGYADVIKNPMDFGTMTVKVIKGKYRSLEEFTTDFRLVTTNAKSFNLPGSIYHSEADRLESWGLDHIARASAHVIEYETDWNIEVEQDDDGSASQQPVNIDDEVSTPRDLDGSMAAGSRGPSTTPAPGQVPAHGQGRRGPRGPYKKHAQTGLLEGLDADGRMPGAKDGVGAFPAGSDWAELMIALKIKGTPCSRISCISHPTYFPGKRYKTKKERLRFEKEGPPYHPDGSLDYTEMEDPFSVLNVFVLEPPARPQVTPLYPPSSTTMQTPALITVDGGQSGISLPRIHAPMPVIIASNRPSPVLSTLSNIMAQPTPTASTSAPPTRPPKKRRHWTIVRNVPARSRAKEKEGDSTADDTKTSWKVPQDAGPADYGTFATFLGDLAASAVGPNTGTATGGTGMGAAEYIYGSEQRLFATIRSTVEHRGVKRKRGAELDGVHTGKKEEEEEGTETFWTDVRAEQAWDYLRDVVYGGVDGYAYVRSLAEFVAPSVYLGDRDRYEDVDENTPPDNHGVVLPLGVPIARYVEDNLVDTVTRGRHGWLRDVLLPSSAVAPDPTCSSLCGNVIASRFHSRLASLPGAARAMALFKEWSEQQLDVAALIRMPEELAKEGVLEGGPGEGGEQAEIERALAWSVEVIEELGKQVKKDNHKENEGGDRDTRVKQEVVEDSRVVEEKADAMDVDAKSEPEGDDVNPTRSQSQPKLESDTDEENPLVKRLRMNLLALAKRAPLDRIAKVPVELVPEDIRAIVPTA
ncbi:hypothetical protein J3R83DRAFT_9086 [Lanmaoa asiatica]|nr:hypothetical protein J3R83DRAFT_9086 [Lanmaoa asiatica]